MMPGTSCKAALMSSMVSGSGVTFAMRWLDALIFRFNLVGADRLNLVEHILLAGHADGDHQDQRGGADHHAQSGQREPHFIAAESLVGETQDLAVNQLGGCRSGAVVVAVAIRLLLDAD